MSAIELKDLYFRYKNQKDIILKGINFSCNYNEITLLTGASGAGKSTFLGLITGIIPNIIKGDIKGLIKVDGKNINGLKVSDISSKIGVVLQDADNQIIMPRVFEEIAFGLENNNLDRNEISNRIDYVTDLFKLDKNALTKHLSGGEKQRLLCSCILAMNQKILIFDEPLANLDKKSVKLLLDNLVKYKNEGYAIIIIEHRLDMLTDYIDNAYCINDGKINIINDLNDYLKEQKNIIPYKANNNIGDIILDVNNLTYKIKDRIIIDNVSFNINSGEKVLILGDNGKGKTTLVRLLTRMIKSTSGSINQYVDTKYKPNYKGKKWFNKIGVVYQNPNYQLFMPTVLKEVLYNVSNKDYAIKLLKDFDLYKYIDRHPQSLSEGEKRRLTVALTLAREPKIIFLDEPTVGQDIINLKKMINIINDYIENNNATLISITHDVRCAYALCDKCLLFDENFVIGGQELIDKFFSK